MQCLQKVWKFAILGSSSVKAPLTNYYLILTSFLLRLSITLQSQLGLPGKKWKTKGITDKLKVASSFSGCFSDFKTVSLTMNKNSTLSCGMLGMAKIDFLSLFFSLNHDLPVDHYNRKWKMADNHKNLFSDAHAEFTNRSTENIFLTFLEFNDSG